MIKKILNHPVLIDKPPVLVDIGASGRIHSAWKEIASRSICLAFDPDDRELKICKQEGRGYKGFILINKIVSDVDGELDFHLTRSPYCSSLLKPNVEALTPYSQNGLFEIVNKKKLNAVSLESALKEVGLDYIDWIKIDTQGTDLRLFASIPPQIQGKVLVAEFEPGIMDAYHGEDKLWMLMAYMAKHDFWVDDCEIKGLHRISRRNQNRFLNPFESHNIRYFLKTTGFWSEISYMNGMNHADLKLREFLLICAFAIVKKQYGFAMEIAEIGEEKYSEKIFSNIITWSGKKMRSEGYWSLLPALMDRILKRFLGKKK